MNHCGLSAAKQQRRREIAVHTRRMVRAQLAGADEDGTSLIADYRGYFLQVSFSELHPLMVFCLARALAKPGTAEQRQMANELNLRSILGCHAINDEAGCYSYRAAHWLDTEMEPQRFYEILDRCVDEADRGYKKITT